MILGLTYLRLALCPYVLCSLYLCAPLGCVLLKLCEAALFRRRVWTSVALPPPAFIRPA
jgi:hypothetical protein